MERVCAARLLGALGAAQLRLGRLRELGGVRIAEQAAQQADALLRLGLGSGLGFRLGSGLGFGPPS